MAGLIQKVQKLLASSFPGADIVLRRYRPGTQVGGSLIWDGFIGLAQIDRQTKLRDAIDDGLAPAEQVQVSFILTLTPDEAAVLTQPDD